MFDHESSSLNDYIIQSAYKTFYEGYRRYCQICQGLTHKHLHILLLGHVIVESISKTALREKQVVNTDILNTRAISDTRDVVRSFSFAGESMIIGCTNFTFSRDWLEE